MRHLLLAILAVLIVPTAGCKGQSVITPEQAMDAVRAFEGDNPLQLTSDPLKEDLEGSEWEHERSYDIDDTQNEDHRWTVDSITGEVIRASYYDARSEVRTEEPTGPLTQAQCRQIAEDFARAKYIDFDTMGFQLDEPKWDGDGWSFFWGGLENIYGASIPNDVSVSVSPADGRIQYYSSYRLPVPMPPPQQPQITSEQALEIVKTAKGLVTGATDYGAALRADPDHTFWSFTMYGENAEGKVFLYGAEVDAITGEIIDIVEAMGGAHMPALKPPAITGDPVSIRDLTAKVPGAKVHWLGKEGARVFVGKNRYTLVPGRDTIEWTGGTIRLSAKMKIVGGRLMVPSGLLDVLKSAPAAKKPAPARRK